MSFRVAITTRLIYAHTMIISSLSFGIVVGASIHSLRVSLNVLPGGGEAKCFRLRC